MTDHERETLPEVVLCPECKGERRYTLVLRSIAHYRRCELCEGRGHVTPQVAELHTTGEYHSTARLPTES